MNLETLHKLYAGGRVERVHTAPTITRHTVAEHCFGVVNMLMWITQGECDAELMKYALTHDIAEQYTGDTPAPAKWDSKTLRQGLGDLEQRFVDQLDGNYKLLGFMNTDDLQLFKWCDMLDLAMFSLHEMKMGNQYVADILQNCLWWGEDGNRSPELTNKVHWERVKEVMAYLRTEFNRMTLPR